MADDPDRSEDAKALWRSHIETGEPLDEEEVVVVVRAGLARAEEWENRGGGLFWHTPTWPSHDD
jgi:hypothetical protein